MMPLVLAGALALPAVASADPVVADSVREGGNLGVGVGGGTAVSGLSLKTFFSGSTSLQGVVGGAGYGRDDFGDTALGVDIDFLYEMPVLATAGDVFDLAWEAGLGGWTWIGDPFWLGANGVVGLQLNFIPVPVDLVLEWRPAVRVVPEVGVELVDFGGHLRFYFG